jgi:quinol-cytochrome oxidoreductase complex cytochrome b subunit
VLLGVALLALAGLAVTGLYLSFRYFPTERSVRTTDVRHLHLVLTWLLSLTTVGLVITSIGRAVERRHGEVPAIVLPVAAFLVVGAASSTGLGLRWSQIALEAVTAGSFGTGIWHAAFDDGVAFVLVRGSEVEQSTYAQLAIVHTIALPLLIAATLGLLAWRRLRRASAPA